ncbi:MAG: SDR family oxidoreductase [Rhizobiales bacterium]|nr:SDR family oxidoreductase [Hyphomicrobiales bacterium]
MHVLVLGAAGMLGRKLVERIAAEGGLGGRPVDRLTLHDIVTPVPPAGLTISSTIHASDLAQGDNAARLVAARPDIIIHLAAVVSGEAEANFELGYHVNLDGTLKLFEAIRGVGDGYCPRVVFTSSIAVYGAPYPEPIPDDFNLTPLTSYGAQKAMGEFLLADYSRRGFLDGVGLRLPTICVRPGKPNKAASGFFSGIIREPLAGMEAILPVSEDVRHWFASPRAAIGFIVHAAGLDTRPLGQRRSFALPGVAATVGEQIEALRRVAGDKVARRIRREPDETIIRIVAGWPRSFDPQRALALGFAAETSFDEIIRAHIADELGGTFVA